MTEFVRWRFCESGGMSSWLREDNFFAFAIALLLFFPLTRSNTVFSERKGETLPRSVLLVGISVDMVVRLFMIY